MKKITNTSQACAYLEKIYTTLNRDKFDGELETPIITIQTSIMTYGHVTVNKIWDNVDIQQYELNISAEYINRPIENVVSTILHEMTHIYNLMHGIQDTSRNGQYHNRCFKDKAESVGLIISRDKKNGWSLTQPGEELITYIQKKKWESISLVRSAVVSAPSPSDDGDESQEDSGNDRKIRKPSSTRKYICPACGQSIRATKVVNILCGDCMQTMLSELDIESA